jgi:hypothetical protein
MDYFGAIIGAFGLPLVLILGIQYAIKMINDG